jgi:hypothetical protein
VVGKLLHRFAALAEDAIQVGGVDGVLDIRDSRLFSQALVEITSIESGGVVAYAARGAEGRGAGGFSLSEGLVSLIVWHGMWAVFYMICKG